MEPTGEGGADKFAVPVRGSVQEIADGMRSFRDAGFTQVEVMLWPPTLAALDAMAPVLEELERG